MESKSEKLKMKYLNIHFKVLLAVQKFLLS